MISEHELIEQIEDAQLGRPLPWVCDLLRSLGRQDPLVIIDGMLRGGYLRLLSSEGTNLPQWKWERLLRSGVDSEDVRVVATDAGSEWVNGP